MKLPENIQRIIDENVPAHLRNYITRMVYKESSGRPDLVSPTGAAGLLQFTKGTGKLYGLLGSQGDRRKDPVANIQGGVRLTQDNYNTLKKGLNRDPTESELALAHQQGAGTAVKMLTGTGNAPARNLAVNKVDPNASPQAAANKIMNYYGFDGKQMPPGMSLATNPYLPQLQHGPTAPSPFPSPAPAPAAPPEEGLLSKMGIITPETAADWKTKLMGSDGKGAAGSPLAGLDDISKGISNPVAPAAVQAAATITPMAPDPQQASQAMAAQQLMAALMAARQQKYGLSLTSRAP